MKNIREATRETQSCGPPPGTSETPTSGFQAPLPLRAVIPAQVQSAKIYSNPTKNEIKDVQRAHIYYDPKPAEVYVVKARQRMVRQLLIEGRVKALLLLTGFT